MKFITTLILTIFAVFPFVFNAQNVNWTFENKSFNAGDTVEVKFRVTNFTDIGAFQYTLKFDTANLYLRPTTKVTFTGAFPSYGVGCFAFPGTSANKPWEIRTVWTNVQGKTLGPNTQTHSLWFIAKKSSSVCASLQLHNAAPLWSAAWKTNFTYVPQTVLCAEPSPLKSKVVSERENTETVSIYPNPFTDVINFSKPCDVQLFDISGKLILSANAVETLNVDLPAGIYFARTQGKTYKLVKQ